MFQRNIIHLESLAALTYPFSVESLAILRGTVPRGAEVVDQVRWVQYIRGDPMVVMGM